MEACLDVVTASYGSVAPGCDLVELTEELAEGIAYVLCLVLEFLSVLLCVLSFSLAC